MTLSQEKRDNEGEGSKHLLRRGKAALYKARVEKMTTETTTTDTPAVVDDAIVQKIRKCLDRGNHANTSQSEAQAALHLARQWMTKYNISQAQIFAQEPAPDHIKHGGQCDVRIERVDGDRSKPVRKQGHMIDLCLAMGIFFNCKSYSTAGKHSLKWTFYGIKTNTTAGAEAFEAIFNLIAEWALSYKGNGPRQSYCLGVSRELYHMANREQLAEEARVKQAEDTALQERERQEAAEQESRRSRLMASGGNDDSHSFQPWGQADGNYEDEDDDDDVTDDRFEPRLKVEDDDNDNDDDDDDDEDNEGTDDGFKPTFKVEDNDDDNENDNEATDDRFEPTFKVEDNDDDLDASKDLDETIEKLIKQQQPEYSDHEESSDLRPSLGGPESSTSNMDRSPEMEAGWWASRRQLVLFRKTAEAIAVEYLKSRNTKLHSSRKRKLNISDRNAYRQGKVDSHKIQVRGRTKKIKDEPAWAAYAE